MANLFFISAYYYDICGFEDDEDDDDFVNDDDDDDDGGGGHGDGDDGNSIKAMLNRLPKTPNNLITIIQKKEIV